MKHHTTRAAALLAALAMCAASAFAAMPDEEFVELCRGGTAGQVKQALGQGANPRARKSFEQGSAPALIWAAGAQNYDAVQLLLAAGAPVDERGDLDIGWTALIAAARNGDPKMVQMLLKAGANPRLKAPNGSDALDYAQDSDVADKQGQPETIRLLQDALRSGKKKPAAQDAGAFSAADLKRMSTFVSNFVEVLVLPDFDMQKGDAPSNPALIYFGVVHNAINNFKSRVKDKNCQVENCEHGSTVIEAKFVAESVRKYFDLNPKHQSHDGGEEGTGFLHFDGKLYHFFWGDGEIRPYAKVKRAVREGGIVRMTGDIYTENEMDNRSPEVIASFTVTAKPHKWNGKDTWAILSLKTQAR